MKNYIQPGNIVTLTAPAGGVVSGEAVLIGKFFGVCAYDAAVGEPVEVALEGVYALPKETPLVIADGAALYWDTTPGQLTTTASGNTRIGAAVSGGAGSADLTVAVRLDGIATT